MKEPAPIVECQSGIAASVSPGPSQGRDNSPPHQPAALPGSLKRRATAIRHALIGAVMTQSFLTSILALGWVQRASRTVVLRQWQSLAAPKDRPSEPWPSWFITPRPPSQPRWSGILTRLRETRHTLHAGLQALACLAVATLPGCLLWAFAWYDGWQNSFAKGYEHALVGPSLFAVGTLLFVIAMLYVPMAQARLAATASWGGFFDLRTVWSLVRQRWAASLGLALLCTGLNLPVSILKTFPAFQVQAIENQIRSAKAAGKPVPPHLIHPADLPPSEQLRFLQRYFLLSGMYVFPAFVLIHFLAARVYASALVKAVHRRTIPRDSLTPWELDQLRTAGQWPQSMEGAAAPEHTPGWNWPVRWLQRLAAAATCIVWLTFMGQVVVSEFIKYSAWGRGWWNQPLLQLPWFNYVPSALEAAAKAEREVGARQEPSPARAGGF